MANEEKKDFNAMLLRDNGMPKIQIVTNEATIKKYINEQYERDRLEGEPSR